MVSFVLIVGVVAGDIHRADSANVQLNAQPQTRVFIRPRARSAPRLINMAPATANGQYTAQYSRPQDDGDTDLKPCGSHCPATRAVPLYTGWIITQCWYQEATPGKQNPAVDSFSGCDYVPSVNNYVGGQTLTISQHVGAPNQDAPQCEGAQLIVNDLFVPDRGPSAGQDVGVKDVNAIWQGGRNVGWLYRGFDGITYVQANFGTQWGVAFAISIGFAGLSIGSPGAYSSVRPKRGTLPPDAKTVRCFTRGSLYG